MTLIRKLFYVVRWTSAIVFLGLVVGVMVVIFPPLASIGVVAVIGMVLLWALPELRVVPERTLRTLFFIMVVAQLCVPAYYAIQVPGLPWISIRRLLSFIVIVLFCITVAGSKAARSKITETIGRDRLLALCAVGFLVMCFLSIVTSTNRVLSLSSFSDALLNWYIPLFTCILIVRSDEDVILLAKLIAIAGIVVAFAGTIEFFLRRRYFFDIFPGSVLASMMADNPAIATMVSMNMYRNGLYRAASIFTVSLSYGEFEAIAAPIGAYFALHGANGRQRILGIATIFFAVLGIFTSGARGAYLSLWISMPIMLFLWTVRYSKLNPQSLVGAISFTIVSMGTLALSLLIIFWPRLGNIVMGGGETVSSTDARYIQWELAKPRIMSNPVTGHGMGNGAEVVGFYTGAPTPTIDSYVISLLVETGIPGFVFFFGMIACGIWIGLRIYLTDPDKRAAIGAPLACSLIAFAIYRLALSQRESHTLFFLIIGLVFAVGKLAYDRSHAKGYNPSWYTRPSHRYAVPSRARHSEHRTQ